MSKFHRTIFLVEILTDDGEYNPDNLGQIHRDITSGDYSGVFEKTCSVAVASETMASQYTISSHGARRNQTPDKTKVD